ncbi:MAG: hypothetical protein M3R11_12935, partial [Acidobacteriota bacterium]|nr:hypothetical protein [Acidobacteriota bacterium]
MSKNKNFSVVENVFKAKTRNGAADKPSKLWLVVFGVLAAAGAWFLFARFYTDYLWFSSVGFQTVFGTMLTAGVLSALTVGAA